MRNRVLFAALWLAASVGAATPAFAQNPFAGTWKLNQEKSRMSGDTLTFGPAAGNSIELTMGGTHYSFRADGQTYALPSGYAAIWRQTGTDSWTTEYRKLDNKLLYSDHWKLSANGKTLTVITSGARANNDLYTDTSVYERTTGTSGLLGTWKSTSVRLSPSKELTIQELGLDRLVFHQAPMRSNCEMTMDGKDAAVKGPDIPDGLRLSLTRTGPYTFQLVEKLNGATTRSSIFTLAADDPRVMTQVGNAPGDAPTTIIWERLTPKGKVTEPKKSIVVGALASPPPKV